MASKIDSSKLHARSARSQSRPASIHAAGASRILVVDDDLCVRRGLKVRLEHAGYQVETASGGKQAIMIFDEKGADLVLLDIKMADIDGFEVCQSIKQGGDVPVIFVTGSQDQIIREYLPQMVEAVHGDYFMRKPFDYKLLEQLIRNVLGS